jgi:hypothetical protein
MGLPFLGIRRLATLISVLHIGNLGLYSNASFVELWAKSWSPLDLNLQLAFVDYPPYSTALMLRTTTSSLQCLPLSCMAFSKEQAGNLSKQTVHE